MLPSNRPRNGWPSSGPRLIRFSVFRRDMDEGTHPNEPEESEADRYLGELRDEVSHLDSEGNQWTEDWTKKNELALREAGSVAGALSEPGFAIIKEVLEKLLAEPDQLQEAQLHGKPIPWDYDPGQERAD